MSLAPAGCSRKRQLVHVTWVWPMSSTTRPPLSDSISPSHPLGDPDTTHQAIRLDPPCTFLSLSHPPRDVLSSANCDDTSSNRFRASSSSSRTHRGPLIGLHDVLQPAASCVFFKSLCIFRPHLSSTDSTSFPQHRQLLRPAAG
jgi:hypothetical protein